MLRVTRASSSQHPCTRRRLSRNGIVLCPLIRQQEIKMTPTIHPKDRDRKRANLRKGLKEHTYLGCPMTKNRSPWCFRMCKPNADGTGRCGRLAPHAFKSRIQQGIEDFKKKQADSPTLLRYQKSAHSKDC